MRFHWGTYFGVSMGPEQMLIVALVLIVLAYAAYRWLRGTVEKGF